MKNSSSRWQQALVVCGAFLTQVPLVFAGCWGNVGVYVLSYIYLEGATVSRLQNWLLSVYGAAAILGRCAGSPLASWNKMASSILGIVVANSALFSFYAVIKTADEWLFYCVLVVYGFATGSLDTIMIKYVTDSSESSTGCLVSIPLVGSVIGASFINPILTLFINPGNLSPDIQVRKVMLFTQNSILQKVPSIFILLGTITLFCQVIGFLLLNTKYLSTIFSRKPKENSTGQQQNRPTTQLSSFQQDGRPTNTSNGNSHTEASVIVQREFYTPEDNLTATQTLRQPAFYLMWLLYIIQEFPYLFLSNYYKLFGQKWIQDDHFFAAVGATLGFVCGAFRLLCGLVLDRFGVRTCLFLVFSSLACVCLWIYFTILLDKWLYSSAVLLMGGVRSCVLPCLVTAHVRMFGREHGNKSLGLMLTGSIAGILLAPLMFECLLATSNWFYIFFSCALLCIAGMVGVLFI